MSDSIFVILFIICIIGFINAVRIQGQKDKSNGGLLFIQSGEYLGGLDDTEGGKSVTIKVYKTNTLHLNFGKLGMDEKIILLKDIKDIGIKSDIEIQKEISLGRLVAFGIFALGMKKQKTKVENYTIIKYNDGKKEQNIILKLTNNENFVRKIKKLIA